MRFIHISIDDVSTTIKDSIKYKKPFCKHIFYRWLLKMHREYNFCVSLYIQNWGEFESFDYIFDGFNAEAANWIKIGIHTTSDGRDFSNIGYIEGKSEWERFCNMILNNRGSEQIIDRFPRLHTFSGSEECLVGMHEAELCSAIGYLSADDNRQSYYLTESINKQIYKLKDMYFDEKTGLYFKSTDLRLDWFSRKFNSNYEYCKPFQSNPYKDMVYHYERGDFDTQELLTVFTHEWQIYSKGHLTMRRRWIKDVCRFSKKYNIKINFPENMLMKGKKLASDE